MSRVVKAHNELVRRCIQHAQLVCDDPDEELARLDYDGVASPSSVFHMFRTQSPFRGLDVPKKADVETIRQYVQLVLGFANGMANWMAVSKRYVA